MTILYARQGDLVIDKLETAILGELEPTKRLTFAGDSSGHPHRLMGVCLSRREADQTLIRIAKAMRIEHGRAGGHKPVKLVPGDYAVRILRERGDGRDRRVED
jgi:hypothetical protein